MPQTRIFRDRIVSMEQTLEGGEKHLELLKSLCREAFPQLEYREHFLDHERDLFVIVLCAPDGRRTKVSWTRMVLFDAERIPILAGNPFSEFRAKVLQFLKSKAGRPEIVVTFRHLEDGWVETREPRREKRRRRRGRPERGPAASGRPAKPSAAGTAPGRPGVAPQPGSRRIALPPAGDRAPAQPSASAAGRRRRFRRRRRGSRRQNAKEPQP